jgi:hypothetical protein
VVSSKGKSKKEKKQHEEMRIDIDPLLPSNFMVDSSLCLAVNNYAIKKSATTKNQSTKLKTHNVHNLLREAKRENLLDSNDFAQFAHLDMDHHTKPKVFNFGATHNLQTHFKDFSL